MPVFENIKNFIRHGNKSNNHKHNSDQNASLPTSNNQKSSKMNPNLAPILSASPPSVAAPPVVTASNINGLPVSSTLGSSTSLSLQHSVAPLHSNTQKQHRYANNNHTNHDNTHTNNNNNNNNNNSNNNNTHRHKNHHNHKKSIPRTEDITQEIRLAEELRQVNQTVPVVSAVPVHAHPNGVEHQHDQTQHSQHPQPDQKYPIFNQRYKLVEKVGDGAFSIVYRAINRETGENVAVKVIDKASLNPTQRSNILKEVAIMRQLKHKNVVQLLDFIESSENYFIVLELIPGGELFHQIVRLTYFSEDLARHVIIQVAEAIRYLHEEAGVVHRDIKPENLLFYPIPFVPSPVVQTRSGEDGEAKQDEGLFVPNVGSGGIGTIKLADFGLSKIIWDAKTMTPCGTVGYTAPEIVNDQRYSKSVDMWALGCVLYTILCGFPPFYDENIQVLTEKVARGEYTFLSPWWDDISKGAKDLVSHLLTVDPDSRYTIYQFLAHPWITQSNAPTVPAADSPMMKPSTTGPNVTENDMLVDAQAAAQAQTKGSSYFAGYTELPPSSIVPSNNHVHISSPGTNKATKKMYYPKTPLPTNGTIGADGIMKEDAPTAHIVVPEGMFVPEKAYMSPAVVAMREAFDVFNAVHRREEENVTGNRVRGIRNSGGAKSIIAKKLAKERSGNMVLGELDEASEEDEENEEEEGRGSDSSDSESETESESDEEFPTIQAKGYQSANANANVDSRLNDKAHVDATSTCVGNLSISQPNSQAQSQSQQSQNQQNSNTSNNTKLKPIIDTSLSHHPNSQTTKSPVNITSPKSTNALATSPNSNDKFFELSLEGSTLIERRKRASSSSAVNPMGNGFTRLTLSGLTSGVKNGGAGLTMTDIAGPPKHEAKAFQSSVGPNSGFDFRTEQQPSTKAGQDPGFRFDPRADPNFGTIPDPNILGFRKKASSMSAASSSAPQSYDQHHSNYSHSHEQKFAGNVIPTIDENRISKPEERK